MWAFKYQNNTTNKTLIGLNKLNTMLFAWVHVLLLCMTLCASLNIPRQQVHGRTVIMMSTVSRRGKTGKTGTGSKSNNKENEGLTSSFYGDLKKYPCLILNSDYRPLSHLPLSLWSWDDSLRALFAGRAVKVSTYEGVVVRSVREGYELPSIIALKSFRQQPLRSPTLTRKGVFLRDNYSCQYCGTRHLEDISKLSLDHLVPHSKGGRLEWTNTVTACMQCNFKKGNNGPQELVKIGMRLSRHPYEPTAYELEGSARNLKRFKIQHADWTYYI
jgi:5-methylcytosine-specific restriction endonuclease McrA